MNKNSNYMNIKAPFLILLSILIFYFIFANGINTLYYAGDDYRYALGGVDKSCSTDDGFYFMLTLGRPVQAYLDCFNYKFGSTLENMRLIRGASVVLLGIVSGLFAQWLMRLNVPIFVAIFASYSIFLVHQLYSPIVLLGANSVVFPLLLVLLANYYENKNIIIPALFIFIALLTYPALTFFYPVIIMTNLLFSNLVDWGKIRSKVIRSTVLFFTTCCVYFVFAYFNMRYNAKAPIPLAYHVDHPNLNVIEVSKRFIQLLNPFNPFWKLIASPNLVIQSLIIIILLGSGIICGSIHFFKSGLYRTNKRKALTYLLQAVAVYIGLFVLSSSFLLVMPSFEFLYNSGEHWLLFAPIAAVLVALLWAIKQCVKLLPTSLSNFAYSFFPAIFFLVVAYHANVDMGAKALGLSEYIAHEENKISEYFVKNNLLQRIHVIVAKSEYPYDSFFTINVALMKILGQGNYFLKWCSLPRGIAGEEQDHQADMIACLKTLPSNGIAVTYSYPGTIYNSSDNMLIIDMEKSNNRIFYYHQALKKYYGIEGWSI